MGDGGRKHSPNDSYQTPTSILQESTERILAPHIPPTASRADYELKRSSHVQSIARGMLQGFPSKYIGQDASQPWLIFWTLESFSILQVGLDPSNKQRSARSSSHPIQSINLIGRVIGQSTRCLPVNIQMADSVAVQGNQRTFCRRMLLYVLWRLLDGPDQVEAGMKLIGTLQTPSAPLYITDLTTF